MAEHSIGEADASVACSAQDEEILRQSQLLHSFYTIPSIDNAWATPSPSGKGTNVLISMSQTNLPVNGKRMYVQSLHISEAENGEKVYNWAPFPFELNGASLIVPSPSGTKLLVVRNNEAAIKEKTSVVKFEIWGQAQLLKEIWVPSSTHGPVYTDGWFQSVSWCQDEEAIAYIAEAPLDSRPTLGVRLSSCTINSSNCDTELGTWKGQGEWIEDWGESYCGKRKPTLYVANISRGVVKGIEGISNEMSVGQVVWAPPAEGDNSQMLVFVGWSSYAGNFRTARRLGMKYCYNRPCAVYAVEVPQIQRSALISNSMPVAIRLTDENGSALCPRFSPDGHVLAFLSAKTAVDSGVHNATNSLHCIFWSQLALGAKLQMKEVVPVPSSPKGGFPGIYSEQFICCPWLKDNRTLVYSSVWRSCQVILATNIDSGKVFRIIPPESTSSWSLLLVQKNFIIAVVTSPVSAPKLMIGQSGCDDFVAESAKAWTWSHVCLPITKHSDKIDTSLKAFSYEIIQVPCFNRYDLEHFQKGSIDPFEAIFISSCVGNVSHTAEYHGLPEKPPLLLVLHGGPHSASLTTFSRTNAFLLALGFNLLYVNYRGSIGFGEEALQSLAGNVGKQDVTDVLSALDVVISKGYSDPDRVAVLGGSHGGFLASHLIGQAPDRFVTAVLRNPVCNLSSMVGVTDIPDWCFVEAYGKDAVAKYSESPSEENLSVFYQASPFIHIHKVIVPTLFLLGAQDRRVPPSNGLQYIQALRSFGLEVKVVVFQDDIHSIDRPQSEFESFLNIGMWLKRFLLV